MKPPRSILDKSFIYRNSASTSVADTIRKERERIEAEKEDQRRKEAEIRLNRVIKMVKR